MVSGIRVRACISSLIWFISVVSSKMTPHIIFILADDLGWNDIGYHNPIFKTPNIDSLAKDGVKLNNYYTGEVCVPSRSMLMSGRYAIRLGLQNNQLCAHPRCLPLDEVTIAEKLKESGYSTNLVGKWHCGFYKEQCLPYNRGFDTFFGYLSSGIDHYTHIHGKHPVWDLRNMTVNEGPRYYNQYSTHLFTREAERIIEQHDLDKPLFLYLAYASNHEPLEVPSSYKDPLRDQIDDYDRLTLAAMTSCLDEGVGSVIDTLKSKGLYDNSVIIFTSDNGGETKYGASNWPLRGSKATLWEGGVRVPAFVNSPLLNKEVRGTTCNELLHVTDWLPTFVHLAGGTLKGTKPLDGFNQWKTISECTRTERENVLISMNQLRVHQIRSNDKVGTFYSNSTLFDIRRHAAIRAGSWKMLTGGSGSTILTPPPEMKLKDVNEESLTYSAVYLFNIENDPEEKYNLAQHYPDIVSDLLKLLGKYNRESVPPNQAIEPKIDFDVVGDLLGPWVK
ncbi:arylsulfatase B-like [Glandiceps talaboti]